jgi:branched-chain amino acid transport system substrate-binding protein
MRRTGTLALTAALVVAAAGCSSGGAGSSAQGSKAPVVFAAMGPNSGSEYNPGPQSTKNQYEALARAWNEHGGIDGHPIKLEFYDTESSASVAVQLVPKITGSGAKAFFSCCFAPESEAADSGLAKTGPITFNADPAIPTPAGSYLFDASAPSTTGIVTAEKFLGLKHWSKVALLTDTTPGEGDIRSAFSSGQGTYHYRIVSNQIFDVNATSVATQVAKMAQAKPDAVVLFSVGPQIATVFSALQASSLAGVPVILSDGDLNLAILKKTANSIPAQLYAPGAYYLVAPPQGIPPVQKAVLGSFLSAEGFAGGTNDNVASYLVDSFGVAVAAVRHLGVNASNAQLQHYVENLKGYRGIDGTYDFSPANHKGLSAGQWGIVRIAQQTLKLTPVTNAGATRLAS